jgi:hypothetical protein
MKFVRVTLRAAESVLAALGDFYGRHLRFPLTSSPDGISLTVGETTLDFVPEPGASFYHFALLVPGNRFEAARTWAQASVPLLPDPTSGRDVFDFEFWNAYACYLHDPAGNIVELIAHGGIGETNTEGDFAATELIGLSELGLVGDPRTMAGSLAQDLGLQLWDGTLDVPGALAFVGERARTFILAPPGRGWLPTGRPAEGHPVDALLSGARAGETELEDSTYRIRAGERIEGSRRVRAN